MPERRVSAVASGGGDPEVVMLLSRYKSVYFPLQSALTPQIGQHHRSVQFSIGEQLFYRNLQWFRGFVFKARRLCLSLNSRLDSNGEKEENTGADRCRVNVSQTRLQA